jgi:hypothetical protein
VHVASDIHLSHTSINKRDSSGACFPSLEPVFIFVPFEGIKFRIEIFIEVFFEDVGKFVGNVGKKLSAVKFKNQVVIFAEQLGNFVVDFSYRNIGKVKVGRELGSRQGRVVSVLEIIVKVFETVQYLQSFFSSSMDCDAFIFFIQL